MPPEVSLGNGILKMKYAEHLQENTPTEVWFHFTEIALRHECSPVKLLYIFRTPLRNNNSGSASAYKTKATLIQNPVK